MTQATKLTRRTLGDGRGVILWSDGTVTGSFGFSIPGVGTAREAWGREADLRAGWALMEDAGLFTCEEIPGVVKAIREAFRVPYLGRPGFTGRETAAQRREVMVRAAGRA